MEDLNNNIDISTIEMLISPEAFQKLKEHLRKEITEEIENDGKIYCKKVREYVYKSREKNRDKYNKYMSEYRKKQRAKLKESGELEKIKEQRLAKQIEKMNQKLNEMKIKNSSEPPTEG